MPRLIKEALHKFQHPKPKLRQHAPHAWTQPVYGATVQYADNIDNSPSLLPNIVRVVQQIAGTLLYYVITVNINMLFALGSIAATQS